MVDFADVPAIRGARLSDLAEHVRDVLAVDLSDENDYSVGKLVLEAYDFVPYALTGMAVAATRPTGSGVRATTTVTLPISDDQGGAAEARRDVTLRGPGDVLGIDPGQIVRRFPPPGSTNSEETFYAHIEFDRPELPWAFSATDRDRRMRPWIALVVFEASEIQWEPMTAGLQPIATVPGAALPPLDQAWAWAHAQATSGSADLSARLSTAYAPVNVSRLLAARVLTQLTSYVACLVPTTDVGRRAGLGETGGTLDPAWSGREGTVRLPVYDHWEFRTAPDGDFARLARRLQGLPAPWEIGRRTMDTSRPGEPLTDLDPDEAGRRQTIRCALYSPSDPPAGAPLDTVTWSDTRTADLRTAIERAAIVEGTGGTDPQGIPDLPIVGPRVYARGQRGQGTVPPGDWFADLNLTVTNRVVAGLGTRVVGKDQEPLMQAAWAQVGDIDRANRALLLAQVARHVAESLHARLALVDSGRFLQVSRPAAARTRLDGVGLTLAGQTSRSATPTAALTGAFRRTARVTGPLSRRLTGAERLSVATLVSVGDTARNWSRPYAVPDGIGGLSALARAGLDPTVVASSLGLDVSSAMSSVAAASTRLQGGMTLATAVRTPSAWATPAPGLSVGQAVASKVTATVLSRIPADTTSDVVGSRFLGGLAAGLAVSRVAGTEAMVQVAVGIDKVVIDVTNRIGQVSQSGSSGPAGHVGGVGPVFHGPVVSGPVLSGPVLSGPVFSGPVFSGPVLSGPVHSSPVLSSPVRSGPVLQGAAVGGVVQRPVADEMLRTGAAWRAATLTPSLSGTLAGGLLGTIRRVPPDVFLPAGASPPPLTDAARIDRLITPQGTQLATWLERAVTVTNDEIRGQMAQLVADVGVLQLAVTPALSALSVTRDEVLHRLQPARTVVDAIRGRLSTGGFVPADWFDSTLIRPIMAAPRFDRPMYKALDDYDRDWLVPGLDRLDADELVTLLSTNDVFTEAFLVGLSDEMGRELLWRGYPTDSRGTYFHRFWTPASDELREPIHRFSPGHLGSHVSIGPDVKSGRAVVVVRGEIVRRYPDLTVMALHETDPGLRDNGRPILPEAPTGMPDAAPLLFTAFLEPDIMLAGLDITTETLKQPGWWIVISEHPQSTRFRRPTSEDLAAHEVRFSAPPPVAGVGDTTSGATVAADRLESPVRVAFDAGEFLP